ncbi:hypothetical protein JW859_01780 [bacterium]|nr:hypothetical protein [bacterium]
MPGDNTDCANTGGPVPSSEPDVLSVWLQRKRQEWWRRWRWVAALFWILVAVDSLFWIVFNIIARYSTVVSTFYYEHIWRNPVAHDLVDVLWQDYPLLSTSVLITIACLLALSQLPFDVRGQDWLLAYSREGFAGKVMAHARRSLRQWMLVCVLMLAAFVSGWLLEPWVDIVCDAGWQIPLLILTFSCYLYLAYQLVIWGYTSLRLIPCFITLVISVPLLLALVPALLVNLLVWSLSLLGYRWNYYSDGLLFTITSIVPLAAALGLRRINRRMPSRLVQRFYEQL